MLLLFFNPIFILFTSLPLSSSALYCSLGDLFILPLVFEIFSNTRIGRSHGFPEKGTRLCTCWCSLCWVLNIWRTVYSWLKFSSRSNEPPLRWGDVKTSSLKDPGAQYQRPPTALQQVDSRHLRTVSPAKTAEVQSFRRTNSSYSQSPHEIPNTSRSPMYR